MKFDIESFRIMESVAERLDDELLALLASRVVSFSQNGYYDFYITFKNDVGVYVKINVDSYYLTIANNSIPYLGDDTPEQIMGLDRLKLYLKYIALYSEPIVNAYVTMDFEDEEEGLYEAAGV